MALIIHWAVFTIGLWRILQCTVVLRENGYEGLTFAIHKSVPEDPIFIENIMDLMTSASEVLYNATHERAFFRDVTIVVPSNWSPTFEQAPAGGSRFEAAEVHVDRANPAYGNIPYTKQLGGCGEPGLYIHVTPEFIRDLHGATAEEFGEPVGRTFVHEWSHFRYGIFDEYGSDDDRSPPIYVDDDGKIQLTGCSKDLASIDPKDEINCTGDWMTCELERSGSSSLMYLPFLPKADGFCGDSEDRPHNAAAPNAQNLMCHGRSTWEVILSHPDFLDGRNMRRAGLNTTPHFRVLQDKINNGVYVLLLDVSGSMSGGRIAMLRRSAARFITAQIPDRSRLGMIAFSNAPTILINVTQVTNENRNELVAMLPTEDDGGNTGIGAAIHSALNMLSSSSSAEGSVIILITDGEENVPPYVRSIVSDLRTSKVVVNTVAFGRSASAHLEVLVKTTGGRGFFYGDEQNDFPRHDSTIESAFFESTSTQADVELRPVELHMSDVALGRHDVSKTVYVDEEARKNVKFNIGYVHSEDIDVVLIDPTGHTYTRTSNVFSDDPISRTFTFLLPMATAGSWTYTIVNRGNVKQGLSVSVTSEPVDVREQPIRIRARINDVIVRFPDDATKTKIYAEVSKGYIPVLDALVIATVDRPSGSAVEILLKDDGISSDLKAGDGVYTAFFSQYNGTGRYSVAARVVNDGRAHLDVVRQPSASPSKIKYLATMSLLGMQDQRAAASSEEQGHVTLGQFQRSVNVGSFRVSGWVANEDVIPPNRVTDLKATNSIDDSTGSRAINLTWTSPGDDLDQGMASWMEVHVGTTFNSSRNFSLDSPPVLGGLTQTLLLHLRPSDIHVATLHFTVRFWDDVGNPSEISNVATVNSPKIFRTAATKEVCGHGQVLILTTVSCLAVLTIVVSTLLFRCRLLRQSSDTGSLT